jgi:hypothetical protein
MLLFVLLLTDAISLCTAHSPKLSSLLSAPACCFCVYVLLLQVVLLSQGMLMFSGKRAALLPWFSETLNCIYSAEEHGLVSDWILDLVNIGFGENKVGGYKVPPQAKTEAHSLPIKMPQLTADTVELSSLLQCLWLQVAAFNKPMVARQLMIQY